MSTTQAPAQTPAVPEAPRAKRRGSAWDTALVTVLSFVTALVISAILIAISDQQTRSSLKYFGHYPGDTFRFAWSAIWHTYQALFYGAIFNPHTAGNGTLAGYLGPISETLTDATPLIAGGLAVGLAFRAGLFNIGGQGQIILGAIFAGFVGFHWHMPVVIHLIVAILAGVLGGALWGGLSGFLKAKTGAHEVITTIMLNYVAVNLLGYLLSVKGFQAPPYGQAISNPVDHNATLPLLLGGSLRVHLGLILSLAAAAFVWWLLKYSRLGFRLRAVGANPFAAKTAGMHVENSYVVVMLLSASASTPSRWRCWAGPTRSAPSSPACSSVRCTRVAR
jgi:simple sugar transport system permease protein